MKRMISFLKAKSVILAIFFVSILLMILLYAGNFFSNKQWTGDEVLGVNLNIGEGDYEFTVGYQCDEPVYLESYITANGQEHVTWGTILEPAATLGSYTEAKMDFHIPYSIHNHSFRLRTPYAAEGQITISKLAIDYIGSPVKTILYLLSYIICVGAIFVIVRGNKQQLYAIFALSIFYLTLGSIFVRNSIFLAICILLFCSLLYFCYIRRVKIKEDFLLYLVFLLSSLVFMLVFTTSSPLFTMNLGTDEQIYYSIAKGMASGLRLYVDMFDHKGPVFYFLYMLGYMISPGKYYGIYFIECVFMALSMLFIYKIARLFLRHSTSVIVAFSGLIMLLNKAYANEGGTYEQLAAPLLILMIYLVLKYFISSEEKDAKEVPLWNPMLQGMLFAIILLGKFNISIVWAFLSFCAFLYLLINKRFLVFFKNIASYFLGFLILAIPVTLYFVIQNDFGVFVNSYFLFNCVYANISSPFDVLTDTFFRIFNQFMEFKLSSIFILIGIVGMLFGKKIIVVYGKMVIVLSVLVLLFTTYMGEQVYQYYFTLVAIYAIFGEIFIASIVEEGWIKNETNERRIEIGMSVFLVLLTFWVNNTLMESYLFDKEATVQDIIVHEMQLRSADGDTSFFELDMLEQGFYPQADKAPYVEYFFYPNILPDVYPKIQEEQNRYLKEKITEYVVVCRYAAEDYPTNEILNTNYEFVSKHTNNEDRTFMLYKRK